MEVANLAYYLVVSHCIIKTFYQRSIFAFYKAALGIANLSKYDAKRSAYAAERSTYAIKAEA